MPPGDNNVAAWQAVENGKDRLYGGGSSEPKDALPKTRSPAAVRRGRVPRNFLLAQFGARRGAPPATAASSHLKAGVEQAVVLRLVLRPNAQRLALIILGQGEQVELHAGSQAQ